MASTVQMRVLITLCTLIVFTFLLQGQEGFYRDFEAVPQSNEVDLEWVIVAGNSCVNTYITRSLDGIDFDTVGTIAGLCGDDDEDLLYAYTDTAPTVNRVNYYRIQFGNVARSTVLPVEVIDLTKQSYQLVYDPALAKYTLYFSNPGRNEVTLETYAYNGQRLSQQVTTRNQFTWPATEQKGFRLFVLRSEGRLLASGHLP